MIQLLILGNLGSAPTVRTAANGREFMTFSVASTNRDKSTTWVNCVANKMESILPYLEKGRQVLVQGSCEIKVYKNEPDISLHADWIQLAGERVNKDSSQEVPTPQEADTY